VRGYDAWETHPAHAYGNEPEAHAMREARKDGNCSDSPEDLAEWASRLAECGAGVPKYAGCRAHGAGVSAVGTAADGH
jgi:predicted metal-dependent phosphoesterase TrpH